MSGQVGSQIKIEANRRWLLANIRSLRLSGDGSVIAETDFLGEGDEDPHTGKLVNFKRGVTGYPIPGARAFPVTRNDLKQIYAADERAHVEIGGSGAIVEIAERRLAELATDTDPSIAMSGQVGSQIKIASGRRWLLANVRRLKVTDAEAGAVTAEIDFLGEGDEDRQTGRLVSFKRGINS